MKIFLSGSKSWFSYFMPGTSRERREEGPLSPDAPSLERTFPTFYEYYRPHGPQRRLFVQPGDETILDSGAFAWFGTVGLSGYESRYSSVSRGDVPDIEHYTSAYFDFVEKNLDRIDYFVELDLADVFGMDYVDSFRLEAEQRGLLEYMLPVWHKANGWEDFDWILHNCPSRMIGVEGKRSGKTPDYGPMIKRAWDAGVRVHVFALAEHEFLIEYPFYSTDCTTWLAPERWGQVAYWDGRIRWVKRRDGGYEHPWGRLSSRKKLRLTIGAFHDAEAFYTRLWRDRGVDWEARVGGR